MELLALVLFNIVFGVGLYFIISLKVTESMKDYQNQKLKKEIQAHTIQFFKESENYLALMDSRITVLKNLIQRAENLGINFDEVVEKTETVPKKEQEIFKKVEPLPNLKQKVTITSSEHKEVKKFQVQESPSESGLLGSIGKMLRSVLGADKLVMEEFPSSTSMSMQKPIAPKKHLDLSVGGNPFDEDKSVQVFDNETEGEEFANYLARTVIQTPKSPKDKTTISITAALSELSENASKVEKVVFLLKRGYSHPEISEELGLAIPEISLIETIKMDRTRRI